MNPTDSQIVDAIAANQLGVDPEQAAASPTEATGADATPTDARVAPEQPAGEAAENLAPVTEDDAQNLDPVIYKIPINGQEREFTAEQIQGTYQRYSKMNEDHANMKDWIEYGKAMQAAAKQAGRDIDFTTLANETHGALSKAMQHNAEMGGDASTKETPNADYVPEDMQSALEQWEKDNAVELPPGYKKAGQRVNQLEQALVELTNVVGQIAQGQAGVTGAAEQVQQEAQQEVANATRQRIATNLDQAQAKYQIADEDEGAFISFMQSRGYTLEDFIDGALADAVMADFSQTKQQPEFERLKAMAEKRQAFTGTVDGSPAGTAPQGAPQVSDEQAMFDAMTETALRRTNPDLS